MIKKILCEIITALIITIFLGKTVITGDLSTADVLFSVCGVLFSVGISLIISLDFSNILDNSDYVKMTAGKMKMQIDFYLQFGVSILSYFLLKFLDKKNLLLEIKKHCFDFHNFLFILLFLTFFFFLVNYFPIAKEKAKIEKKIHDERNK